MRMQAVFNGTVVAESDETLVVEGNHYFSDESLRMEYLTPSEGAAWPYRHPLPLARKIKGRVAFWRGVVVRPVPDSGERASQ